MNEIPLLHDIVIIFGLSIFVLLFCHRIRLPNLVGFLVTGVLCGPYALGIVECEEDVQTLANIGIALLLFIVGMEFSFKKILEYRRYFLIGGAFQVFATIFCGLAIAKLFERSIEEAIFMGFLLSLSSTAIVLRLLDEKRETDTPHGHVILGIMIFQDIVAIPMMLLIPLLASDYEAPKLGYETIIALAKSGIILTCVLFGAIKLVPMLLFQIAKTRSRELFLLTVLAICSSVAWVTSNLGLSLSLGAFLAGLIIADSDYRLEAIGDITPFQDIFTSFFFVSVGMLLNIDFFLQQPFYLLFITLGVITLKAVLAGTATFLLGMPLRTIVLTGISMAQIGEFSFVLAKSGFSAGLGNEYYHQLFLSVALLTMALTPILISLAPAFATKLLKMPLPIRLKSGLSQHPEKKRDLLSNHIIIIGFGLSGRHLARSAKGASIPYIIIEMNAQTVRQEKLKGEPIHFGDASHESVLHHAMVGEAKVVAVVINDFAASAHVVEMARKLNPHIYIVVRTRYLKEVQGMYSLGADDVIPDEFGSSVEVFTRVLRKYETSLEQLQKIVAETRAEGYEMLRSLYQQTSDSTIFSPGIQSETFHVHQGSPIAGKTLAESEMRKLYNVNVILIRRGGETLTTLNADTRVYVHDLLILSGRTENLKYVNKLFAVKSASISIANETPVTTI